MSLTSGTKLGPYEIVDAVGAGGMGEVYRANDTRLGRTVAIKVLPNHLTERPEIEQRFKREARTISNLSHPNICTLYDIGNDNGIDYLVMEFLEGDTLADRLAKGTLSPQETLRIAVEITEALEHAHRGCVVHRDLKPGNIMLTKSGVKLLDFGLAKIAESSAVDSAVTEMATGQSDKPLTAEGTIMGTFQYMAPEQLEGKDADTRSDIFSLGAVLYEMASGKRAFEGTSQASLIAAILKEDPRPISELNPMTPPALDRITRACLEKNPDDRLQSAHDVKLQLSWISEGGSDFGVPMPVSMKRRRRNRVWIGATVFFILATAVLTQMIIQLQPEPKSVVRLTLSIPPNAPYDFIEYPVLSPDGKQLAFLGRTPDDKIRLWVRPLDQMLATELPATDGANMPFWSPDSRWIGYLAESRLMKVRASGGPPQALCEVGPRTIAGAWGSQGDILFGAGDLEPLYRVPETGGTPVKVTELSGNGTAHFWATFLPDGENFLFLSDAASALGHHLSLGNIKTGKTTDLINAISNFQFVPPDRVLFARSGTLLAQRFDMDRLELTGEPTVLAEDVVDLVAHHYEFSSSDNGILAFRSASPFSRMGWYNQAGHNLGTVGSEGRIHKLRLSPDNKTIVYDTLDPERRSADVFLLDIARESVSRFTMDPGSDGGATWSPDGQTVAFASSRTGQWHLYTKSALKQETPRKISKIRIADVVAWSPDGRHIAATYTWGGAGAGSNVDFVAIPVDTTKEAIFLTAEQTFTEGGDFSRDGKWIAYDARVGDRQEVFIQSFPDAVTRVQVSTDGAWTPRWSADGRMLFYQSERRDALFAVDVRFDPRLQVSAPRELFKTPREWNSFDIAKDGRLLAVVYVEPQAAAPVTIILNWTELLKAP